MKKLLISFLLLLPCVYVFADTTKQLSKRCERLSKRIDKIIWDQRSYGCRKYLAIAAKESHQGAGYLLEKNYQDAYGIMVHVRALLDYSREISCQHWIEINEGREEARSIIRALENI